jgi:hypothetical protein
MRETVHAETRGTRRKIVLLISAPPRDRGSLYRYPPMCDISTFVPGVASERISE